MLKIMVMALILTACGSQTYTVEDDALRPMVEEFFNDCARHGDKQDQWMCANLPGRGLTIKYVAVLPVKSHQGLSTCTKAIREFEKCTVFISRKRTKNKSTLKTVIYHELGHAVLGRGHVTGEENCDAIMFTHGESCISQQNWDTSRAQFWLR